ncbi:MAG: hypothetical protein SOW50_09840, partial [Lachnospiraceae bacterium]|nr:hypothetical protein [Lachnospiraceae bacterium]
MREERMICGTKRNKSTCKRMRKILFPAVLLAGLLVCGCSDGAQNSVTGVETENTVNGTGADEKTSDQGTKPEEDTPKTSLFLGKYDSFEAW